MYLPISVSTPIFIGGMVRWGADKVRGVSASEVETETSPGVLLSSGYIAGGTVCGLIIAFFTFLPYSFNRNIDFSHLLGRSGAFQSKAKVDDTDAAVEKERKKGDADMAKLDTDQQKAERAEETQKGVDGIYSDFWLESGGAKIISLIAFGLLGALLFWQGIQKPPKETPDPSAPPPGSADTRITSS
jgi:hypothetical protein